MAGTTAIPRNRAKFTRGHLLQSVRDRVSVHGSFDHVEGVSTDTRALEPGAAFVAIKGETHDGHDHLAAAKKAGAVLAIVERDVEAIEGLSILRVNSTLDALGDLARIHAHDWRRTGDKRVIGITGSAGKTTTRVAVSALLSKLFPNEIHASKGNLNNRVGLPMVMLELEARHRVAVLEMGMNQPGEIEALAKIAEPDVGILTLIAAAHTEFLGTVDDVAREKTALLRALSKEHVAIGCADDARVREAIRNCSAGQRVLYGRASDADVRIVDRRALSFTSSLATVAAAQDTPLVFETPLLGEAGTLACAAAIAAARFVFDAKIDSKLASAAFGAAEVGGGAGRLVPKECADGLAIIDDSYNANPASMVSSIRAANEIAQATKRRLVLVLGAMRELGGESRRGHEAVGEAAAESHAGAIFGVGGDDAKLMVARAGKNAAYFANVEEALLAIEASVGANDLVLVKGSRGIATERVVDALEEHARETSAP